MAGTPPPLRGRRPEVQLLRSRLAAASRDGRGAVVVLVGDPGSGKSRLLQQVRLLAGEVGARVLDVLGDPDEDVIPHGPVLHAVQAGPEPLLDRSALDRLPSGADQGWFLRQVLLSRLQEVAVRQPVVVCVDDLQWCGHGTLRLIRTLPALLSTDAVVWVVAVRSAMSDPAVASTVRVLTEAGADLVELGPLDSGAVAQLVGDVLGAVPDAGVLASAARAQGHPLLLVELLRGWLDERLVEVDGAGARLRGQVLPARLREAVERRTERLSPVARELLQIGAVLGRHFPPEVLAAMLDRPAPAVLSPLQEVVAAGLLETDGDRLRFTHDLIREAVVAGIPSAFCRELRRHAVDVLVARGAPTLQVATMLAESAVPGDLDAVSALREAAAGLAPTASPAAADFSLRALELLPEDSPLRPELVVETIKHLWQCGRAAAAEQLATCDPHQRNPASDPEAEARVRLGLVPLPPALPSREPSASARRRWPARTWPRGPHGRPAAPDCESTRPWGRGARRCRTPSSCGARERWVGMPQRRRPSRRTCAARAETYVAFHRQQWDRAFSSAPGSSS
jgi:hypothetical protein